MNKQNWTCLLVVLALIGGTAVALVRTKQSLKLGPPGIKTAVIPGSRRLDVYLPPKVLNYDSEIVPTDTNILNGLPHDTSFAQRRYLDGTGNFILLNVVLMGTDRTSIHKPQFCLAGSGWDISASESCADTIRMERPHAYDLPVMKLISSRPFKANGAETTLRGVYVYWFVAEHELTEDHWVRMRRMSTHLLATGELQRWAYVSCFAVCLAGDEAKTYDRMKKFLVASVPEFQLTTGDPVVRQVSPQAALR